LKSIESKLKSFLKLIDQKNVEGGQKKVRVIEYPQIVWGGGPLTLIRRKHYIYIYIYYICNMLTVLVTHLQLLGCTPRNSTAITYLLGFYFSTTPKSREPAHCGWYIQKRKAMRGPLSLKVFLIQWVSNYPTYTSIKFSNPPSLMVPTISWPQIRAQSQGGRNFRCGNLYKGVPATTPPNIWGWCHWNVTGVITQLYVNI